MKKSLIDVRTENEPFELTGFGLSLGFFEDTYKYHIFADHDTAQFVLDAMNRQIGKPKTTEHIIFPAYSEPHDGYEGAYAAELRRGKRIAEALLDQDAILGSEPAASTLLDQMRGIGKVLQPLVQINNAAPLAYADPIDFWLNRDVYNTLCLRGIGPPHQ